MHATIIADIKTASTRTVPSLESSIQSWSLRTKQDNTDHLSTSIISTVIFTAKKLNKSKALLLQDAVSFFLHFYHGSRNSTDLVIELGDGTVKFSARWLLNHLILYLQPYMSYRCVIRKIGTVLYPNGGDLLTCLSYALHDAQVIKEDAQKAAKLHNEGSFLMEAGAKINDKIHKEIKEEEKRTINLTTFNLNESIDRIDLELWNFICCCTRTTRERKSNENEDKHAKNIRRFFLLCIMMITTNSLCTTVLHHLVADAVEVYGGSRSLLSNRSRYPPLINDQQFIHLQTLHINTEK